MEEPIQNLGERIAEHPSAEQIESLRIDLTDGARRVHGIMRPGVDSQVMAQHNRMRALCTGIRKTGKLLRGVKSFTLDGECYPSRLFQALSFVPRVEHLYLVDHSILGWGFQSPYKAACRLSLPHLRTITAHVLLDDEKVDEDHSEDEGEEDNNSGEDNDAEAEEELDIQDVDISVQQAEQPVEIDDDDDSETWGAAGGERYDKFLEPLLSLSPLHRVRIRLDIETERPVTISAFFDMLLAIRQPIQTFELEFGDSFEDWVQKNWKTGSMLEIFRMNREHLLCMHIDAQKAGPVLGKYLFLHFVRCNSLTHGHSCLKPGDELWYTNKDYAHVKVTAFSPTREEVNGTLIGDGVFR